MRVNKIKEYELILNANLLVTQMVYKLIFLQFSN